MSILFTRADGIPVKCEYPAIAAGLLAKGYIPESVEEQLAGLVGTYLALYQLREVTPFPDLASIAQQYFDLRMMGFAARTVENEVAQAGSNIKVHEEFHDAMDGTFNALSDPSAMERFRRATTLYQGMHLSGQKLVADGFQDMAMDLARALISKTMPGVDPASIHFVSDTVEDKEGGHVRTVEVRIPLEAAPDPSPGEPAPGQFQAALERGSAGFACTDPTCRFEATRADLAGRHAGVIERDGVETGTLRILALYALSADMAGKPGFAAVQGLISRAIGELFSHAMASEETRNRTHLLYHAFREGIESRENDENNAILTEKMREQFHEYIPAVDAK